MQYVVVDFEWNQSPYGKHSSNKKLPFEIIEIGAVKLNGQGQEMDRFNQIIKPKVYKKLHHVTKNLTGISEKELSEGRPFCEVMPEFLEWCGDDYMFCTWGNLDLLELQRNLKFFHMEDAVKGPITYHNVQKLFRLYYLEEDSNSTASLECAVEYLNIEKKSGFHRAIHDAEYTAEVFVTMDLNEVSKWYTVDYYQHPKRRRDELKLLYPTYSKYVSKEFANKEAAMADREVRTTRCFACGKPAAKRIRWFVGKNKVYYCLAECEEHGYLRGKIRIKKTDDETFIVVKTIRRMDEAGAQTIVDMKEEVRKKRLEKRHKDK